MKTRIRWTADERTLIINTLTYYLRTERKTAGDLYVHGAFKFYFELAQSALPEDRRRQGLDGWSQAQWLLDAALAALKPASAKPKVEESATKPTNTQSVAEFVAQNFDAVVAELSKTHLVIERSTRPVTTLKAVAPRERKVRVLVCGLKPVQANELQASFGSTLDLIFVATGDLRRTLSMSQADYAIGVTSFMSHPIDEYLRGAYKARYIRVVGALSSVTRSLNELVTSGRLRQGG